MSSYNFNELKNCTQEGYGKKLVELFKNKYDKEYKDKPIVSLSYAFKKMYYINGDRSKFEEQYFDRRKRLALLQILAIADDAYLDPLEDLLYAICEESTWVVPAHNLRSDKTFDHTVIDLFSAETALYLSETIYVFGSKLSPHIVNLVRSAVEDRIIKNYENREFDFESATINWAPVCACGIGVSYLFLFPDKFNSVKDRLFATFASYLNGFDEQGYCEEGISYWQYGFGMFCVFFDVFIEIAEKRPEFLDIEKVKAVFKFACNSEMDDEIYLPFADGGTKRFQPSISWFLTIKNLYPNDFKLPRINFFNMNDLEFNVGKPLYTKVLSLADKYIKDIKTENKTDVSFYYKFAQVFIRKTQKYSFVAKGGCNGDSHNHNDVGAFQIVKNCKRLISDYGAGKYTKDYFMNDDVRYGNEVFVCGSQSHSVPIIDGITQSFGKEYRAKVISQDKNSFLIDIAGAYDSDCKKALVKYTTDYELVRINYSLKGIKDQVIFRFVSDFEPNFDGELVTIEEMSISCDKKIVPKITRVDIEGHTKPDVLYTIDYEICGVNFVDIQFDFNFKG